MQLNPDRLWWLIPASFLAAFLWQFWPLSPEHRAVLPDAIVMTTLYWTLRRPLLVNSGWAFVIGLLRDGIEGTPPGSQALALVIVCYIVQLLHEHWRLLQQWQQVMAICALCFLYLLIGNWISLIDPARARMPLLWVPALTAAIVWPLFFLVLSVLEEGRQRRPIRH